MICAWIYQKFCYHISTVCQLTLPEKN